MHRAQQPEETVPELPEVETVRRGLSSVMEGQRILRADIRREGLRWPFPANMGSRLQGKRVERLHRRAKYILADLSSGETLIIHLGMSGRMLISGAIQGNYHRAPPAIQKHDHVVLEMENGARIVFNDARRFGAMDICATEALSGHRLLAELGPEPLGNAFSEAYLLDRLKVSNSPIKTALLNQKIVAGLGNIYVCEVLHRTGISPKRKAKGLAPTRIRTLVPAIRDVLSEAIESGGSSLRDHRQTNGELGYFQHSFRVYDKEGAPCPTPDCQGNIARIVQSGRSSFYCPSCQR